MGGLVAIIGRPNVGKSTLFNRLLGQRSAIVDDLSGVTRDRHYGRSYWEDTEFNLIDTGGYVPNSEEVFEKAIREQVHIAMEEADALLFMVDRKTGLLPRDKALAQLVRKSTKPVFLVVNKLDNHLDLADTFEFYELGFEKLYPVSSLSGSGTGELLDDLIKVLPEGMPPTHKGIPRFAVVGRPNVGKSSLINALLGKDQNIVTPISGTTRDTIHTHFTSFGLDLLLVDTAGLRKRAKRKENVEFYSTLRSIKAIEDSDVVILVLDAELGIEVQDLNILRLATKNSKGLVILVNKWDLIDKETNTSKEFSDNIAERILPLSGVPVVYISAIEKKRLLKGLETAIEVFHNKSKKIPTAVLNEKMLKSIERYHPPAIRGKFIRIKYVTQIPAAVPTFLFFANHPKLVPETYKRYLENQLRDHFGFEGVPLNVFFREKN